MKYERILAWTRMMPRNADGSYALERFSVMDVEACIAGAVKEAETALHASYKRKLSRSTSTGRKA